MDADAEFRLEMGATWLNLLTTLWGRRRDELVDLIGTPRRLDEWLAAVALQPRKRPDLDDLSRAHALRDHLYRLARAVADEQPPPRDAVRALNDVLALDAAPRLRIVGDVLTRARPDDTSEALARIVRQAADQLAGADRPRLRACGDDTCAGIFVDDSGRRRWCNDARCGSRVRVRAHRARTSHPRS